MITHSAQVSFDNYSPAGDLAVIAICIVMAILLLASYVNRNRSLRIFLTVIVQLTVAAVINIIYHALLTTNDPGSYLPIYGMRILYNAAIFNLFFLFALYITVVSELERRKARHVAIFCTFLTFAIVATDAVLSLLGVGFHITSDGIVVNHTAVYMIGFVTYVTFLVVLMTRVRHLVYKRVMYGFYGTTAVSVLIQLCQLAMNFSSLTTMSFAFPTVAMLYIMHSTPYNVALGAVDKRAMANLVQSLYTRRQAFVFMSLLLPEYDEEGKTLPEDIRSQVRRFSVELFRFRNCVLFQLTNGRLVLIFPKKLNPNYETQIGVVLKAFDEQFQRLHNTYKIVIGESIDEISRKGEYESLIRSVEYSMPDNTVRFVGPDEIARFNRDEYILKELTDIYNKRDLDDPRVLAFCQPVYNLRTGRFDTAEALMRLKLEKTGLVFPDEFISIAEDRNYIHVLTEIILHKTCRTIKMLIGAGFNIERISVNVSVLELKDDAFCSDIDSIIAGNDIPGERIALELTESRNETDFVIMKEKVEQLHREGIRFYLDDFGTGYSNMERIMELPFDIIKFDRTMVIASGADPRSARIVENLANMFRDMNYAVLYEGVENEGDEARCREMSATYLQGYKYSRPVPIEQLKDFL